MSGTVIAHASALLHIRYAMSGTVIGPVSSYAFASLCDVRYCHRPSIILCIRYAMYSTEMRYAATRRGPSTTSA
eukprot:3564827-Rhodomonas_salina.4